MPFVGNKLSGIVASSSPVGDPQLAGLLSWASAIEDASNGLMPNDGAITLQNSARFGTYYGRLCWESASERTYRIVHMVATYAPRSPLVVVDMYYNRINNNGSSKRVFGLPIEAKETGYSLQISFEGGNSFIYPALSKDSGTVQSIVTRGSMRSDTWFSAAYGMQNTVDGGNGNLRFWDDAVEASYDTLASFSGPIPWQSGADAYWLNFNTGERSIRGGIADFRIYDIEQIDPSYNSIEELLIDIRDNRDRPLGALP